MNQLNITWCKKEQAKTLAYVGVLLVASGIIHLGVFFFYGGSWEGEVSWRKPVLFGISAGLTSISMGWVWASLTKWRYDGFLSSTAALALLIEVGLIDFQQWRGVASHFNRSTPIDSAIYNLMGLLILWVTGVIIFLTVRSFTEPLSQPTPMVIGIQYGLIYLTISCLLGIIINISGDVRMQHGLPPAQFGCGRTKISAWCGHPCSSVAPTFCLGCCLGSLLNRYSTQAHSTCKPCLGTFTHLCINCHISWTCPLRRSTTPRSSPLCRYDWAFWP